MLRHGRMTSLLHNGFLELSSPIFQRIRLRFFYIKTPKGEAG